MIRKLILAGVLLLQFSTLTHFYVEVCAILVII